jgi:hypothetical protein
VIFDPKTYEIVTGFLSGLLGQDEGKCSALRYSNESGQLIGKLIVKKVSYLFAELQISNSDRTY